MNKIYEILNFICLRINLIDKPNSIKKHKNNTPLIGGIIFMIIFSATYFLSQDYSVNLYLIFSIMIIGILDDIYDLNANLKFIISLLIIFIIISYDKNLQLIYINFFFFKDLYFPENIFLQIFLPTLCLMLLLNAFNMTDGINTLATLIFLSWLTYIFIKFPINIKFFTPIILGLLFFLYFNFSGKAFLGDGGNYFLSMLIGSLIINTHNKYPFNFFAEEIFLLLMVPGIDMLRLFIQRLKDKQNPFKGDRNHLHHCLVAKYGHLKALLTYLALINIPIYLYLVLKINIIFLISINFLTYCYLIKNFVLRKI